MRSPSQCGHGPVLRLGGTFADHDHRGGEPRLALLGLTARLAPGATGPQGAGQLAAQLSASLDVEGLVDRLVDHVHLRPLGEPCPKSLADLLRAPPQTQAVLDEVPQLGVLPDLSRLGAGPAGIGAGLGGVRPVLPVDRVPVAADLPADGGRAAAQLSGDRPDRRLLPQPVGDVDPVVLAQVPGRTARRHHLVDRWCRLLPAVGTTAVTPLPAGPRVDTDQPAGFLVAVALLHEPGVFRALPTQLHRPLSRPVPTDLEVHRIP